MPTPKLLVIGLDCAAPQFLFDPQRRPLPHIHALMARGVSGVLESCDPPITVPAWACMTTGVDPGVLGCYGFRNRVDRSYAPMRVASSLDVCRPRVWDLLGSAGLESVVVGVPQTYPPQSIRGHLVTGLLTPDTTVQYTHPPDLAREIEAVCGGYVIDVPNFRTNALEETIAGLDRMLDNRFAIAEHLLSTKPWNFFMLVDIGLDRLHHALWRYADPNHPVFVPDHPFGRAFDRYYEKLDAAIGRLLERVPDETAVLVVSDHGAKPIFGAIRINQWLIDRGYLKLNSPAREPHALEWDEIDWSRTKAFSTGGYYARIFLNVEGREPQGCIPASKFAEVRAELADEIRGIGLRGPNAPSHVVLHPENLYGECNGIPPDLLVYFGNLHYRAVGTVGVDSIYADANDTGADEANHAKEGVFMLSAPGAPVGARRAASIYDMAPTILDWFGVLRPPWMRGTSLIHD